MVVVWRNVLAKEETWGCAAIAASFMIVAGALDGSLTAEEIDRLCVPAQSQLTGRLHNFNLRLEINGLILKDEARSYHTKELAQQAVMRVTAFSISFSNVDWITEGIWREETDRPSGAAGPWPILPFVPLTAV